MGSYIGGNQFCYHPNLESLEFCLKLRGSEAINLVHIRQDLVESGHRSVVEPCMPIELNMNTRGKTAQGLVLTGI